MSEERTCQFVQFTNNIATVFWQVAHPAIMDMFLTATDPVCPV